MMMKNGILNGALAGAPAAVVNQPPVASTLLLYSVLMTVPSTETANRVIRSDVHTDSIHKLDT